MSFFKDALPFEEPRLCSSLHRSVLLAHDSIPSSELRRQVRDPCTRIAGRYTRDADSQNTLLVLSPNRYQCVESTMCLRLLSRMHVSTQIPVTEQNFPVRQEAVLWLHLHAPRVSAAQGLRRESNAA